MKKSKILLALAILPFQFLAWGMSQPLDENRVKRIVEASLDDFSKKFRLSLQQVGEITQQVRNSVLEGIDERDALDGNPRAQERVRARQEARREEIRREEERKRQRAEEQWAFDKKVLKVLGAVGVIWIVAALYRNGILPSFFKREQPEQAKS